MKIVAETIFPEYTEDFFLWKEVLGTILDPLDTEYKLNVYKNSGKRPRRLLDILC